jgi:hypothetical protein
VFDTEHSRRSGLIAVGLIEGGTNQINLKPLNFVVQSDSGAG